MNNDFADHSMHSQTNLRVLLVKEKDAFIFVHYYLIY